MKKLLLFLCLGYSIVQAQVSQPKKIGIVSGNNFKDTIKNSDIRERLVQLAMNNPSYEISDRMTYIAAYQLRAAKGTWLAAISAQGNLNEFTIKDFGASTSTTGTTINNGLTYPRYNFGISIPFDIFARNSNAVRIARENVYIAQALKNEKFRQVKAEVLTKYEDYLLSKQKLDFQSQLSTDAYTNYQIAERDYRLNNIKAEDYSKAYRLWVAEQVLKLDLQRNFNVAKIEMEKLIGVKLEDVFREN